MSANDMDTEPDPPPAGDEHPLRSGDEVEATGWAAEIERLAGASWMALSASQGALRGASHHLDPELVRQRSERLAKQRAETIDRLHGLARDHHTNSPLLHWLDAPWATRRLLGLPNEVMDPPQGGSHNRWTHHPLGPERSGEVAFAHCDCKEDGAYWVPRLPGITDDSSARSLMTVRRGRGMLPVLAATSGLAPLERVQRP